MEIKKVLQEIQSIDSQLDRINAVIGYRNAHGVELVVSVGNNLSVNATADVEFLYEALLSQREVLTKRNEKLHEALKVAEKVLGGLLAQ